MTSNTSLQVPSKATLQRYGLSVEEWRALADKQDHVCFICRKPPKNARLCIDHYHAKGWKKMPAEDRKKYVRGLLCWFCNHYYVGRAITIEKASRVVLYLQNYEKKDLPPE